jgi:hypothetical protein
MKQLLVLFAMLIILPWVSISQSIAEINTPTVMGLDQVAPFHEGLAAVRQGDTWGFINTNGELVIEFRDDLVWNENPDKNAAGVRGIPYPRFRDGRCPIRVMKAEEEGIPFYGFIDSSGEIAIQADFLNVSEFANDEAVGIYFQKTFRGKNNFQLNIYDYSFTEGVINTKGEMVWPLTERKNILMNARRYEIPPIQARMLEGKLIAVEVSSDNWEIRKIQR